MAERGVGRCRPWVAGLVVFGGLILGALAGAAPASAHALPQTSDPAPGATLAQSPPTVTIIFGEQPDPRLSSIVVLDTNGGPHQQGHSAAVAGRTDALQVAVSPLTRGVYTVSWRTVSEADGHLASGSFAFGVDVSPTGATASAGLVHSPPVSPWSVVSRWMLYVGLMLLAGVAVIGLLGERPKQLVWLAAPGWLVAAVGVVGLAQQQRVAAGLSLSAMWHSSLGHQLRWRAIPVAIAFLGVVWLARRPTQAMALGAVGGPAGVAMFGDIEASHAAGNRSWRWFEMLAQWVHFAAASVWIGGLAVLVVVVFLLDAQRRRALARRFSTLAGVALALVALTGTVRALNEVRSWHGLFDTTFGRWVIVKVALLFVIAVLGLVNRTRAVPTAGRSIRLLRQAGSAEVALAAVALVAAGFLQSLAPPSASASQPKAPPPIVATGTDAGTTMRIRLQIGPGTAGFNRFVARVTDYDTGRAVIADQVTLTFNLPARPDLGQSTLVLSRQPDSSYAAQAANLSVNGTWRVTVLVQRGANSAEVPMTVTPRETPVKIDVSHSPGLPDVYTIHVNASDRIQVYLDPGHPGLNEFHATVIGPGGSELSADALTVTASSPGGGASSQLAVRKLDTLGHFVADLPGATKGRYHFSLDASATGGQPLHADITLSVS